MKKAILAVSAAMIMAMAASGASAEDWSLTPSMGISPKGDFSGGAVVSFKGVGVSGYLGGEPGTAGRRTIGGADLRINSADFFQNFGFSEPLVSRFPGLSTYLEGGVYLVDSTGGSVVVNHAVTPQTRTQGFLRPAIGGGLSYTFKVPDANSPGFNLEIGYHSQRGVVLGVGIKF